MQKVRHHTLTVLWQLVGKEFQVLLTPLPGSFSPFPHGTCPLSVTRWYLALEGGPPRFPQDSTSPVVLRYMLTHLLGFKVRDFHPLWSTFPDCSPNLSASYTACPTTPYGKP